MMRLENILYYGGTVVFVAGFIVRDLTGIEALPFFALIALVLIFIAAGLAHRRLNSRKQP